MTLTGGSLASRIDQTLLGPTVGFGEGARWIEEHAEAGFAALVVPPFLVPVAAQRLAGTPTAACSVAGFPLGYQATETKAGEARLLVELGCREVDVVVNVGALLEGEDRFVTDELAAVVRAVAEASEGRALVKAILETGRLDEGTLRRACGLAEEAGVAFVKTSTGFGPRGASVDDVRVMRDAVGDRLGVKASGGIRTLTDALALVDAGADRLGTSAGAAIVAAAAERTG